ncbi:MAG: hypothetical protein KJO86_00235 [Muriicola sp.]|nr:hypothetical protein [Muriicola sp.]
MINKKILNARDQELRAKQAENAKQRYQVNWAVELNSDTIFASSWSSEDAGVTLTSDVFTDTASAILITGDPGRYRIVNKITTTASGEEMERYIDLIIMDNTKTWYDSYRYYGYS